MMKFVILRVFLTLFVPGLGLAASQGVMTRETSSCQGRQTPGPICETCELLATCVRHSNGWVNIPVETCETSRGYYCNSRLGMCSNMTGPCHPFGYEGNFPCTSHGIFPDPYDCQKYHMCYFVGATLVSATVDCGNDRAFDAATGQCTFTLDNAACQEKQFNCLRAGDAFAWPNSPNIFYVCKATSNQNERILYPTLYRCNDGDIFNGFYCLNSNSTSSNSPLTVAPSNYPDSLPTKQVNITNGITAASQPAMIANTEKCTVIGLLSDVQNCRKYFYCSAVNGILRHMECPLGTYYNAALSACTVGICHTHSIS